MSKVIVLKQNYYYGFTLPIGTRDTICQLFHDSSLAIFASRDSFLVCMPLAPVAMLLLHFLTPPHFFFSIAAKSTR
jgi:hypothetical protein